MATEALQRKHWKQETSLKKIVIKGNSGDWGMRNGDSSKKSANIYILI